MIKILKTKFECKSCGTINTFSREIVVDEFMSKIEIIYSVKCSCGSSGKNKLKLIDLNIEDLK